jgi:hypothetical protein
MRWNATTCIGVTVLDTEHAFNWYCRCYIGNVSITSIYSVFWTKVWPVWLFVALILVYLNTCMCILCHFLWCFMHTLYTNFNCMNSWIVTVLFCPLFKICIRSCFSIWLYLEFSIIWILLPFISLPILIYVSFYLSWQILVHKQMGLFLSGYKVVFMRSGIRWGYCVRFCIILLYFNDIRLKVYYYLVFSDSRCGCRC